MMLPGVNRRVTSEPPLDKTFTESVLVITNSNIHGTSPQGRYPDARQILLRYASIGYYRNREGKALMYPTGWAVSKYKVLVKVT